MKTTLNSTLAALSAILVVTLTLSSCESGRRGPKGGGMHNMAVGSKDRLMMSDENMPGRSRPLIGTP